ncbi:MAG: esterase, partial [Gammaproteobacteria bacterium]
SWRALKKYTGAGQRAKTGPLDTPQALGEFVESRASYIAQTALYGYMKTRAGTRFPALFENAAMLESINIAKWRIWLACLSDLAVYCGVLLRLRTRAPVERIRAMLAQVADEAVARAGAPGDAGADFAAAVREMRARIERADFDALGDDDSAFTESPEALVYWAPIADELKAQDAEIIRNSVRFRWQEIRRVLRKRLRAEEVMAGM